MLKKLPVDQRDFAEIRMENAIYADKTKIIYELLNLSQFVFLSRPRRFGKSPFRLLLTEQNGRSRNV